MRVNYAIAAVKFIIKGKLSIFACKNALGRSKKAFHDFALCAVSCISAKSSGGSLSGRRAEHFDFRDKQLKG